MRTVIIAGFDNLIFSAADTLNPRQLKLIGFATTMEEAWNIYDEQGNVKDTFNEMPVMPLDAAVGCEPDLILLAASEEEEDTRLKYMVCGKNYRGEVISLYDRNKDFSAKTAVLRKLSWRLEELGVEGAAADLGAYRGDISWQLNALMPERTLYLFDTFTGYDRRDVAVEQQKALSDARTGQYGMTERELEHLSERLLGRMPYPANVVIKKGWFPKTAEDLEEEKYALVHMDTGLYQPTYAGIQYFYPRMSQGGVIVLSGYEDGKRMGVRQAVFDLEQQYGAFLFTPLGDADGSIVILRP